MLRRWHMGLWLISACGALPLSRAADVDVAAVRRIVAGDELPEQRLQEPERIRNMLDSVARDETQRLGSTDWTPSHPKWAPLYHQVRSDLEAEQPAIVASLEAVQGATDHWLAAIASGLSPQDLKAILAYYDSAEGQRYEQFIRRVDALMVQGLASKPGDASSPPDTLSQQQQHDYTEMLMLSRTFLTALAFTSAAQAAHQDTSGFGAMAALVGMALRFHQPEVAAVFAEYRDELPAFSAFEKTPAAQNLFKAMGQAWELTLQLGKPFSAALESIRNKYRDRWMAAYAAQTRVAAAGKQ
jgi:hypothetical protein